MNAHQRRIAKRHNDRIMRALFAALRCIKWETNINRKHDERCSPK